MEQETLFYLIRCSNDGFLLSKEDKILVLPWYEAKSIVDNIRSEISCKGKSIVKTTNSTAVLTKINDINIVDINIIKNDEEKKWDM